MSHSFGEVIKAGETIGWFEYNGTSDYAQPKIYSSSDEVWEHWRESPEVTCTCGNDEPVILYSTYGNGFHWPGRACLHCRAITAGRYLAPEWNEEAYITTTDGRP